MVLILTFLYLPFNLFMIIYIDCYIRFFFLNINNLILNFNSNIISIYNFFIFYQSNSRLGTRSQKNRSKLNFSTKKIYKQKGTGRARAGSLSSPIRRKGARSFPNNFFENYKYILNKNNFKFILFSIFSRLIIKKKFYLVDDFFLIKINTKDFLKKIKLFNFNNWVLLTFNINYNFYFSQRNIINFKLINLFNFTPLLLFKYDFIFLTTSSIKFLY